MARATKVYTVDKGGKRDAGKAFLITEMNPIQSYKWGCKALIMLMSDGWEAPAGVEGMGLAGLASLNFSDLVKSIKWELLEPLLDELMTCVKIIPNPNNLDVTRNTIPDDIEEWSTYGKLQAEVFQLHINFI